jgi:drug/metabolite transporter (DMT)-like permease
MNWLLVVIVAYFLNSIAMVIDRRLLTKTIPDALVYTFYIGVLSIFFLPFFLALGIIVPTPLILFFSFLGGGFFILALFLMYQALSREEVSKVIPFIGGLSPVFIFLLAVFFLGEILTYEEILAFFLILSGGFLVSLKIKRHSSLFPTKVLKLALFSAFFFAFSYVLTKYIYNQIDFVSGFFWIRLGAVITVLALLILPGSFGRIRKNFNKNKKKTSPIFLVGQLCGGLSMLFLSFALSLAPVTLVNSLQGLQYGFLFLLIYFLSKYRPKFFKEEFTLPIVAQKTLAIALIAAGLFILSAGI